MRRLSTDKEPTRARSARIAALAAYGGSLIGLRPHWGGQGFWTYWALDPERALVDAAALTGWCLAAWLFIATALTIASSAPTAAGRLAAALARMITPRIARRFLEAALGLTLAVGPAGAALAAPAATPPAAAGVQQVLDPVPAPIVAAAEPLFPDLDRPWMAVAPAAPVSTPAAVPTTRPAPNAVPEAPVPTPAQSHVVSPGDTLWDLAAAASPGASPGTITRLWQQWYATNRSTIGADPSLLLPGELLSLPHVTA